MTKNRVAILRVVVRGVVKTFGGVAVLRGVNAELKRHELTIIEGSNGSGKTTLLRIIGTIMKPTTGMVDYEPIKLPLGHHRGWQQVRSQLGWLSHESLSYGDLSGRANIEVAAQLHGLDPISAWERSRERFALGRFADRALKTNSRGQRQRIALARALVHRPTLVLLDEPTAGLDRAGVQRLRDVIAEEVDRGAVVGVVSHEPEVFADLARSRMTLKRGRVTVVR